MKQFYKEESMSSPTAANYVGVSESSLRQGRMNGYRKSRIPPPPFYRMGRVIRYRKTDLDEWLRKHRVDLSESAPARLAMRGHE